MTTRPGEAHFEVMIANKKWVWAMYSANRRFMAASPTDYKRRADAVAAIQKLQQEAPLAPIMIAHVGDTNEETPCSDFS